MAKMKPTGELGAKRVVRAVNQYFWRGGSVILLKH